MATRSRDEVVSTAARAFWIGAVIVWVLLELARARRRYRAWFS